MSAAQLPGWYGKLPMLGDFASRRLDAAWVRGCDDWLSAGLRASQAALGAQWLDRYLGAPVWRFAWGPGVVDARWWFGVLVPSCDSVGRYFPLLIVLPREHPPADRIALDHLELWWTALTHAGLGVLAEGATAEGFEAALARCPPWPSASRGPWVQALPAGGAGGAGGLGGLGGSAGLGGLGSLEPAGQTVDAGERWQLRPGAGLADLAAGLAAGHLAARLSHHTLWWPVRAPGEPGLCTVLPGLPPAEAFAALWRGGL